MATEETRRSAARAYDRHCAGTRPEMKIRLVVQFDAETRRWSATFPEVPGCTSAGDTEAEAVASAKEALALWFEPRDIQLEEGARVFEVSIP